VDQEGRSYLREQSFSVPAHLSKPFLDEGVLVVNLVTPTAGLFSGDTMDIHVQVKSHARLLLTSPSATRVHRMTQGRARMTQKFSVGTGARLDVWPEIFIPQGGARYEQKTWIEIERGGELLFVETLAPGRVASGEVFAFDRLDWETDIFYDGERIVRERYRLSPATASLHALSICFPQAHAYQATCFVISERLRADASCWTELLGFHNQDVWIGCSQLVRGGWSIKLLARDSIVLRKYMGEVRRVLHTAAGWNQPGLRRV
jgi:urease accessory protein